MPYTVTAENILIGAGELYIDSVGVGYTRDGVVFNYVREIYEVEADQSLYAVKTLKMKERVTVGTNLLEATLDNLKLVWDVPNTVEVSSGQKSLKFGGGSQLLNEHELIFIGTAPGGYVRTVTVYRVVSSESGEHAYKKNEETRIPVTFLALADDTKPDGERIGSLVDTTA